EELLVQVAAHRVDHHVLAGADVLAWLAHLVEVALDAVLVQRQPIEPVHGVDVDRQRHQLAIDTGQHPVLVRTPFGEAGQIVEDALAVGVEDVRPVGMHQHAMRVGAVVGVAADMVALVDHDDLAALLGQFTCHHGAAESGAHPHDVRLHWPPPRAARTGSTAPSNSSRIVATVESQDAAIARAMPSRRCAGSGELAARAAASRNSWTECATSTTGVKLRTTSATAVETTGLPVAMYSRVLVGLM